MLKALRLEPAAISGAIVALLNALVLLEVIHLTADQIAGINTALAAIVAVFVRQLVTPTAKEHTMSDTTPEPTPEDEGDAAADVPEDEGDDDPAPEPEPPA